MKKKISTIKHFDQRILTLGFIIVLFFSAIFTKAQNVAINTDGSKADPNAIVDIKSSSKGLLIPRMTTAQRMKIPQTNGMLVYDMNTKTFWFSNGESWQNIAVGAAAAVGA